MSGRNLESIGGDEGLVWALYCLGFVVAVIKLHDFNFIDCLVSCYQLLDGS